ncbi:MAG: M20/M25/M40 family metallo-hydrolase [Clostridia bacterium]|nr:M20/M25/M40 family metallo-hydrolase [Clostridia bacterium]
MLYVLIALILGLAALAGIVSYRTYHFVPPVEEQSPAEPEEFDREAPIRALQALVRCKTVSYRDHTLEDNGEFKKLYELLPRLYPNVAETCEIRAFPDRGLLYRWRGKSADTPAVLMAHYDVVPVVEEAWDKPAFEGILEDGVLWGRGTLDTKVTFNGILSAAEALIAEGFVPENDVYFAFSGGEEVNGLGAVHIVDYFEKEGISPALVLDEGGAVVENVFPGVARPCGMIGIAEKGMMDVEYRVRSAGGHASAPKPKTPLTSLARACTRLAKHPARAHLTPPVAKMFDTLGRHSSLLYRVIFANLWLFFPVLDLICKKSGGELNALMRTTVAFTQAKGSDASNVIPPEATLVSNIRLNPADTMASCKAYLERTVADPDVSVTVLHGIDPSRISRTDVAGWEKVKRAVEATWQGCITSPYLMVQCSDSRHWGRISDRVYRFSAMDLTSAERATIHGNNERIRVSCALSAVEFYRRLMRTL